MNPLTDFDGAEWDPKPEEKQFFQHKTSGDMGWLVRREGKDVVRLDRPGVDECRPYNLEEWIPRAEVRPVSPGQAAKIYFDADKSLCVALGLHGQSKAEWLSLTQQKKRMWIERGPDDHPERIRLYRALRAFMAPLVGS